MLNAKQLVDNFVSYYSFRRGRKFGGISIFSETSRQRELDPSSRKQSEDPQRCRCGLGLAMVTRLGQDGAFKLC